MSDSEDKQSLQHIEELLKRKAELEEQNNSLSTRLQDGEKIKNELKEARRDSQKLLHHREKLKIHANKHLQGKNADEFILTEPKRVDKNQDTVNKAEKLPTPHVQSRKEDDILEDDPVQLRRQLNALQLENASLIKEKRKTEEQKSSLVQELADLGTKYENLQTLCYKLKEEIGRLSTCLGGKSSERNTSNAEKEEDIELMKAQLRLYQEEMNGMQAQIDISQRSNERLRAELSEARAVIRDLKQLPAFEVYPAPVFQPAMYRTYEDRYGNNPRGYRMVRSAAGGYIEPMHEDYRPRVRSAAPKKNLFMPDLTAVIDYDKEVVDNSLMSSKSF